MAVPSREQATSILVEFRTPGWLLTHSTAVAEVATFLAQRIRENGRNLPPDLPETAALLHDVDKTPPLKALKQTLGHGIAGASWLASHGFDDLGPAVAGHPATRLADEPEFERWLREATLTELLVSYADKRATFDVVPLSERFDGWQRNHPERAKSIERSRPLADRLERKVCEAAGIDPSEVIRLAW